MALPLQAESWWLPPSDRKINGTLKQFEMTPARAGTAPLGYGHLTSPL